MSMASRWRLAALMLLLASRTIAATTSPAPPPSPLEQRVSELVARSDAQQLAELGAPGLDALAALYRRADRDGKLRIAGLLYSIGKLSPAAADALMPDAHTTDVDLRIQVQYALGRVSDDEQVVQTLLATMRTDPSPLLRDKAACALAYDQIHLSEKQKVRLFAGLIQALAEEEPQVRAIAIQALRIHTGQTKGYDPAEGPVQRQEAILRWQRWLLDYRNNL